MAFEIESVLREGAQKLTSRTGLLLVVFSIVLQLVGMVAMDSVFIDQYAEFVDRVTEFNPDLADWFDDPEELYPFALDIPSWVASLLGIFVLVGTLLLTVMALNAFAPVEVQPFGADLLGDRLGWVAINLLIGGIVFTIAWGIGLALFVVPGIFIFVVLIYFIMAVVVEQVSFIEAMRRSASLTKGHRWTIFMLFLVVWIAAIALMIVVSAIQWFDQGVGQILMAIVVPFLTFYCYAITASSYRYLVEAAESNGTEPDEGSFDEFTPARA